MKSIRRFLVLLLSLITLTAFVAALQGYLQSMQQAELLFNQHLLQQAKLIEQLLLQSTTEAQALEPRLLPLELPVQWLSPAGQVLAHSALMPADPLVPLVEGFTSANFHGYRWHLLVKRIPPQQFWLVLAERDDQRYQLAEAVILHAVYPMVLVIPMLGAIIWFALGIGLRPIHHLATLLHQRQASDLGSVPTEQLPAELLPLTQSINQLLQRLEASFDKEKRFSADAAHELRTPIAVLKIHLDNLLQETQAESALKLQQGLERMEHLVEQVMLLNRTLPDNFMEKFEPINLNALLQHCIAEHSFELQHKQHDIELEAESDCVIRGNRFALEALFNNLLSNAIKYTPAQGRLQVILGHQWQSVSVWFIDNGPGIAIEERQRVFDRFYRGQHPTIIGCGLGLSIVKQVVALHQAQLLLSSGLEGKGLAVQLIFERVLEEV